MQRIEQRAYRLGLGLATLLVAIQLSDREADERRHARKQSVLAEKWTVLRTAFPDELVDLQGYGGTGPSVRQLLAAFEAAIGAWPVEQRRALLIDVLMGDPFAPYELKIAVDDARDAIRTIAVPLGLDETEIGQLWQVWDDALAAYRPSRWRRSDHRVKRIPALTTGEPVGPPPEVDPADDGGADDVLASDHNLALLAGGSLSVADTTMAGGMWLLTPPGPDGHEQPSRQLLALPLAGARAELVKAQMAQALIIEPGHRDGCATDGVVDTLETLCDDIAERLDAERERNEDDAVRIRTIEALLRAVVRTHDRVRHIPATPAAA